MNGEVFGSFTIKPDQMQVLNPFLILAFIPIFDQLIYPAFAKIGLLKKPLQRLTVGGVLAGIAFVVSGILELQLEPTYAVKLGANEAHVNFINGLPCSVRMEIGGINSTQIEEFGQHILKQIEGGKTYAAKFTPAGEGCSSYKPFDYQLETTNEEARSYMIMGDGTTASIKKANTPDKLKKDGEGASKLKFLFIGFDDPTSRNGTIQFREGDELMKVWQEPDIETDEHGKRVKPVSVKGVQVADFDSGIYKMEPHETTLVLMTPNIESQDISKKYVTVGTIKPKQGGNYLYVIKKESGEDKFEIKDYVITQPNSIHMLWLIPQFVIITVGEVMFSVTGLQFAFSQAPSSMKSVLQASWLLTVAFGNVIVVFLAEFKPFEEQSKEFFLYSGLMFVDMIIFAVLAYFYIPVEISEEDDKDTNTVEMRESSPTRKKNEEYKEA
ncbi:unnamed protein product [Orchesella dallaii]|uniref:Peptide transporter family 1 n=1 Tax=Orchesella dallaii TaxID=48710 RepID=A0ABP1PNU7_9HEXA